MVNLVFKILQLYLMVIILNIHQFQSSFFCFDSLHLEGVDKLTLFAEILIFVHLYLFLFDFKLDLGLQVLSLDRAEWLLTLNLLLFLFIIFL